MDREAVKDKGISYMAGLVWGLAIALVCASAVWWFGLMTIPNVPPRSSFSGGQSANQQKQPKTPIKAIRPNQNQNQHQHQSQLIGKGEGLGGGAT
jgi:hypothetical protein